MTHQLTPEIIQAAIEGLEARQSAIGQQIGELRAMLPGSTASSDGNSSSPKQRGVRKPLSAAARARIAAAQRARWAKSRGESQPAASTSAKSVKKKRRLS